MLELKKMKNWKSFIPIADEFIVLYSIPPYTNFLGSKLFCVGHALELYLKAVLAKQLDSVDEAIKKSHRVSELLIACRENDQDFLTEYVLKENILEKNIFNYESYSETLEKEDQKHLLHNFELYLIAKHLPDLKYLSTQLKSHAGSYAFGAIIPNPYWSKLFKLIRDYLELDSQDSSSVLKELSLGTEIPVTSKSFIEDIVGVNKKKTISSN